jgi:hypothetical protein
MPIILVILAIAALALLNRSRARIITAQEAAQVVASNPQVQAQIDQTNAQLQQAVQYDIQTGQHQLAAIGATATAIVGGLGIAASNAVTGTLLFTATSWTIVGGIVAGVFALVSALRSDAHLYANELVKKYENPFAAYVIQAYQALEKGVNNPGTMTGADGASLTNAVILAWAQYQEEMDSLIGKGGNWSLVATQSKQNLDSALGMGGLFNIDPTLPKTALGNGWMTTVINQMTAWTGQLEGGGF